MNESVYGNHIGIVINDQDPENRSRLQVFIPNVSNTLYSGWNDQLKDLSFKTFETQQQSGGISQNIAQKLYEVLPWAEASAPHFGGGTSAPVNPSVGAAIPNPQSKPLQAQQNPPTPVSVTSQNNILPLNNLNQSANAIPSPYGAGVINGSEIGSNQSNNNPANGTPQYISISELQQLVQNNVQSSGLVGTVPADGANYGITTGSLQEWTNFYVNQATTESQTYTNGGNTYIMTNDSGDNGTSNGIFSITSSNDFAQGINVLDPSQNVAVSIAHSASLIKQSANYTVTTSINGQTQTVSGQPVISGVTSQTKNGFAGVANYWGPARPGTGPSGTYSKLANVLTGNNSRPLNIDTSSGQTVIGYSPNRSMVGNMVTAHVANGGANGFFSKPSVGAKVWVFFYGGDVQKPVYFGSVLNGSNVAYQS